MLKRVKVIVNGRCYKNSSSFIIIISLFKKLTNRSLIKYTTISEKREQSESVNKLINIWLVCMAAGYNVYHSMQ